MIRHSTFVIRHSSLLLLTLASLTHAQTKPSTTAPTTAPVLTNTDVVMTAKLNELHLSNQPFANALTFLADNLPANILANWPALQAAGVTRDTPARLHLYDVTVEDAIRALIAATPTTSGALNYTVGGGAVVITTNAELAKAVHPHFFAINIQLDITTEGKPTDATRAVNAETLKKFLSAILAHVGEPTEGNNRKIVIHGNTLAVTQSDRAIAYLQSALAQLASPYKLRTSPVVTTPAAKKAQERLTAVLAKTSLVDMVKNVEFRADKFSFVILPGAAEEAAKPAPALDTLILPNGITLIGPAASLKTRTIVAVYDTRDLLKRLAFKSGKTPAPPLDDFSAAITKLLQEKIEPGTWGDLGKSRNSMTDYSGLLIVFAPPDAHRALATALADMYK